MTVGSTQGFKGYTMLTYPLSAPLADSGIQGILSGDDPKDLVFHRFRDHVANQLSKIPEIKNTSLVR
jgi:hypothetical protein